MTIQTLHDLNAQIAQLEAKVHELRKQGDEIRKQERAGVIDVLRTRIAEYGLTAADLKLGASAKTAKGSTSTTKSTQKAAARYRSPAGEEWSGGRGRKPRWVTEALAAGKSISDFEVK